MTAFQYTATDQQGKRQKGTLEADSLRHARQQLRDQRWLPLDVQVVSEKRLSSKSMRKISQKELSLVTRQMATLISAGIPLDDVLSGVAEQAEKSHVRSTLLAVRARVLEGHTLADAMANFKRSFSHLYKTTIAAGEKSGKLDHVLEKLADYIENQRLIRQKVQQALLYPMLMTAVSSLIVVFLLMNVVPKIITVFTQAKTVLPLATVILVHVSNFLQHDGLYLIGVMVLSLYLSYRLLQRSSIRLWADKTLLGIPVIGKTIVSVNSARFARTLSILTSAGVPVLEAMQAAGELIRPLPFHHAVIQAVADVREGSNIHLALKKAGYFSPLFLHLVASGEASGQLAPMLEKTASQQESDVSMLLSSALTLFEPVMILVMGAVVLFIVLAIMLPIFDMDQMAGQ